MNWAAQSPSKLLCALRIPASDNQPSGVCKCSPNHHTWNSLNGMLCVICSLATRSKGDGQVCSCVVHSSGIYYPVDVCGNDGLSLGRPIPKMHKVLPSTCSHLWWASLLLAAHNTIQSRSEGRDVDCSAPLTLGCDIINWDAFISVGWTPVVHSRFLKAVVCNPKINVLSSYLLMCPQMSSSRLKNLSTGCSLCASGWHQAPAHSCQIPQPHLSNDETQRIAPGSSTSLKVQGSQNLGSAHAPEKHVVAIVPLFQLTDVCNVGLFFANQPGSWQWGQQWGQQGDCISWRWPTRVAISDFWLTTSYNHQHLWPHDPRTPGILWFCIGVSLLQQLKRGRARIRGMYVGMGQNGHGYRTFKP